MNQREASRKEWGGNNTIEDINSGSLQRIADACEKMAVNHIRLQQDHDNYKRWYHEGVVRRNELERKITALRGVITRMKNKAKQ